MHLRPGIVIILFTIVAAYLSWCDYKKTKNIYVSDMSGYYAYNPAIFIYKDIEYFSFHHKRDPNDIWIFYEQANGKRLNKYTIGVALMSFPFFITAHAYTLTSGSYTADGYSPPYQIAGIFATLFWTIFGLIMLSKFLRSYFSNTVVALTLLAIAFGTNLFYYTAYEHGASHSYSFALFAAMLYLTYQWHKKQHLKYTLFIALTGSMIVLVRPVNILFLLIPFIWNVYSFETFSSRIGLLIRNYKKLLLALIVFLIPVLLQLSYWHYITGKWIVYSYANEYFDFSNPHIIDGLFSFRKGWFIYTPMAFVATIGYFFLWKKDHKLTPGLLIVMAIVIYVTFSWWMWWYGGSFGCRPLIEYLALMALPLGALFEYIVSQINTYGKTAFFTLITGLIALNIFQQYQFSIYILHWDRMSREYYFKIWGKANINALEYEKYLIDEREYWNELHKISR